MKTDLNLLAQIGMRPHGRLLPLAAPAVAALLLFAAGCSSSERSTAPNGKAGTKPAIVIAVDASSPEQPAALIGAFADVPSGELDRSKMVEANGYVNIRTQGGWVFVYSPEEVALNQQNLAILSSSLLREPCMILGLLRC